MEKVMGLDSLINYHEECEMQECQDMFRLAKPKEVVIRLNHRCSFDHCALVTKLECHFRHDHF